MEKEVKVKTLIPVVQWKNALDVKFDIQISHQYNNCDRLVLEKQIYEEQYQKTNKKN